MYSMSWLEIYFYSVEVKMKYTTTKFTNHIFHHNFWKINSICFPTWMSQVLLLHIGILPDILGEWGIWQSVLTIKCQSGHVELK